MAAPFPDEEGRAYAYQADAAHGYRGAAAQADGLRTLFALAPSPPGQTCKPDIALDEGNHADSSSYYRRAFDHRRGVNSGDYGARGGDPVLLAARQEPRGALSDRYDIPRVEFRRRFVTAWVSLAVLVSSAGLARHVMLAVQEPVQRPIQILWSAGFAWMGLQWALSWLDKPHRVTRRGQRRLNGLRVTVVMPLYNEDPRVVDRALYALSRQTRLPDRIEVVDDGSTIDYTAVRTHWQTTGPELSWWRQDNAGKKHAQALAFRSDTEADIFVTIDSDTALEGHALEEGLKPFADPRVQSVAGMEIAANPEANWLTRTASTRSLFFQITACGVQSAFGEVLVNRGAFALYRGGLLRDIADAYTAETFLGMPVLLGDDAALTMFARGRGRTVQQPSAFAFTMYPETLSHHFRQWVRWMRATLIRDCWRLRYLPLTSYGWWYTVINTVTFLALTATPLLVVARWPASEHFAAVGLLTMFGWASVTSLRLLCVRRSDESWLRRIGTLAYYPAALMWGVFVLRPLRFYGIATWRRQGWVTRQQVEVSIRSAG
jgi:hyaluronan synthase